MARRFTRSRGRAGNSKAGQTLWVGDGPSSVTLASANAVSLVSTSPAALLALRPFTVLRTRGFWQCRSDQTAASEDYGATIGYCVVSDQAIAVGVTAVPTPETDLSSDAWYVHETLMSRFEFVSGVGFHPASGIQSPYDSKGMRRVEEGFDFILVAEALGNVASASLNMMSRILIKLH